jgi:Holliday junction resolvase
MTLKNAKAKGAKNELRTVKYLEARGYLCTKSGGSLGAFDIIALSRNNLLCVQVKSNMWPCPAERQVLRESLAKLPENAYVECWRWEDGQPHEPMIRNIKHWDK